MFHVICCRQPGNVIDLKCEGRRKDRNNFIYNSRWGNIKYIFSTHTCLKMPRQFQKYSHVKDATHVEFTGIVYQHRTTCRRNVSIPTRQFIRNQHPISFVILHTIITNTINIYEKVRVRSKVVNLNF